MLLRCVRYFSIFALVAGAASAQAIRPLTRVNVPGFNPASANANNGRSITNWGKWYLAVYAEQLGTSDATEDIFAVVSGDGGFTWSAPSRVDVGDPANSTDSNLPIPAITEDPMNPGQPIFTCVWEESRLQTLALTTGNGACDDVFAAWSTDGVTWNLSTTQVGSGQGIMNLGNGGCVGTPTTFVRETDELNLFASAGHVYAIWEEDAVNPGCSGGNEAFYLARSADGGRTFDAPRIINLLNSSTACTAGVMGINDVDNPFVHADGPLVVCTWCDDILALQAGSTGDDVWVSVSFDFGQTFLPPVAVENSGALDSGDVDDTFVYVDGLTVALYYQDNELHGRDAPMILSSTDGGMTWGAEQTVSPATVAVPLSGVDYLDCVVSGFDIYYTFCSDHEASTAFAAAPSDGGNSATRQLYISYSHDGGNTWTYDVNLDPGRANSETFLLAKGNKVFIAGQVNPFGGNDLGYWTSLDGGASFAFQIAASSLGSDVDQSGARDGRDFAGDLDFQTGMSVLGFNVLGQNETYVSGVRTPSLQVTQPSAGLSAFEISGVFEPSPGTSFVVALSVSGTTPSSVVAGQCLNFVIDATTLAVLGDPILLPFLAGSVGGLGTGAALPFPTLGGTLGLTAAAASIDPATGSLQITDPIGL